jgi:hypothetical protein
MKANTVPGGNKDTSIPSLMKYAIKNDKIRILSKIWTCCSTEDALHVHMSFDF